MKRILSLLLMLALVFSFASCQKNEKTDSKTFFVMDTFLTLTLYGEREDKTEIFQAANNIAREIEEKASRTLETSEVSAFNRAEESYTFSPDMAEMLKQALAMCEATEGAYDITVAPLVDLWHIKEGGPVPNEEAIQKALSLVSYQNLSLDGATLTKSNPKTQIDLGSVAKGYAVDKIAAYLMSQNCDAIVNFGGNVAVVGAKEGGEAWRVSVRSPFDADKTIGRFNITTGAVAVSGDYERYFEEGGEADFTLSNTPMMIFYFLFIFVSVNVGLAVFNLLPIPPLDGSKVLGYFTSAKVDRWFIQNAQLVHFIFLILLATRILRVPLGFISSIIMNGLELATAWVPLVFAPLFG